MVHGMALTALRLRSSMRIVVGLDPVKELLPAFRVPDVLDPDVYALLDVPVPDDFVHDDAHRRWGYVVDDTSAARGRKMSLTRRNETREGKRLKATQRTHGSTCAACPSVGRRWL